MAEPESAAGSRQQRAGTAWVLGIVSFALPMAVYLRTLAPTVYGLDSAELTTAAYCLGVAHPPGYPLYVLVGYLFAHLPVANVGYRMNLMSAFWGALAAALLALLLLKMTRRPLVSLVASLALACSFFFWSAAVMAEVYTLHLFLMAALFLLAWNWQEQRRDRWLYLLAFLYGLSLGNHLAMLLLLPGLLWWLLSTDVRAFWSRRTPIALSLFLVGLAVYLYLPLRYTALVTPLGPPATPIASWQEGIDFVTARVFWRMMFAYRGPEIWSQVLNYLYSLWGNFLGIGLVIGGVGIVVSWPRWRNMALALTLMFLANAVFFVGYRASDKEIMFLPTYLVWALWLGLGCDWLVGQVQALVQGRPAAGRWVAMAGILLLALPLAALVVNLPRADLSQDRRTYEWADGIFTSVAPEAYVLTTSWFEIAPLEYLHVVEQRRPDITVLPAGTVSPEALDNLVRQTAHPLYSTASVGWLEARYDLEYVEPCACYRVWQRRTFP